MRVCRAVSAWIVCLLVFLSILFPGESLAQAAFSDTERLLTEWAESGRTVVTEISAEFDPGLLISEGSIESFLAVVKSCAGAYQAEWSVNGGKATSIWESKDSVWLSFGSDKQGDESLCIPIENSRLWNGLFWDALEPIWEDGDILAASRIRSIPDIGEAMANPVIRFWSETDDKTPIWDMLVRQWERLRLNMSVYGSEGSTANGMSGIDRPSHCTIYVLTGEQVARAMSNWAEALACDPQMLWLFDAMAMDNYQRAGYLDIFRYVADAFAGLASDDKLTFRVYLDNGDAVCGISGNITMRTAAGANLPLRVTYKKNTSGSKVIRTLSLTALPDSGDGFTVSADIQTTDRDDGYRSRSFSLSIDARLDGVMYRLHSDVGYVNTVSGTSETISGKGTVSLRSNGVNAATLNWVHTATGDAGDAIGREDVIEFDCSSNGRVPALGTEESSGSIRISSRSSDDKLGIPVSSARNLVNMSDESFKELYSQVYPP